MGSIFNTQRGSGEGRREGEEEGRRYGVGEKAKWLKYLLYKLEDWNSDSQNPPNAE